MTERILGDAQRLRPLTCGAWGHTLNHRQVFSPSGLHAYFDARNADAEIQSTDRIGRVELASGQIDWVYRVSHPTPFGPGVGAVACHPRQDRLVFIHGLWNCDAARPYGVARRFGALCDAGHPSGTIRHAEARCVTRHPPRGALRGGTHAHSWSADGRAISFTYNDAWILDSHARGGRVPDLRTVGVMRVDSAVEVQLEDGENFSGTCHAMLVAPVRQDAKPGSDALAWAREECFLGPSGRALAFIGRVITQRGEAIEEIYVARWAEGVEALAGECGIDDEGRLQPPEGMHVSRLTRTEHRKYPGISGPRSWLLASPDGATVYGLMRNDAGVVCIAAVDAATGEIAWLAEPGISAGGSVDGPLALDASGSRLSWLSNGRLGILDLASGDVLWSPDLRERLDIDWGALHFLPDGTGLLFHARAKNGADRWQQLWTWTLH